jgi:hypothetical protein
MRLQMDKPIPIRVNLQHFQLSIPDFKVKRGIVSTITCCDLGIGMDFVDHGTKVQVGVSGACTDLRRSADAFLVMVGLMDQSLDEVVRKKTGPLPAAQLMPIFLQI